MTSKLYDLIYTIITEELDPYLSGQTTLEEATEQIQSRAMLVLSEME